jgi:crotonyl-CoA carboxylase/reductase
MLHGWTGNTVKPGDPVLIWGGSGGIGSMAIQIAAAAGAKPIAVISKPENDAYCKRLGALGTINRKDFNHWGLLTNWEDYGRNKKWLAEVKRLGKRIWEILGEKRNPTIVVEHPGSLTVPTSCFSRSTRRHGGDLRRNHRLYCKP